MNPYAHGKKHEIGLDLFVKGFSSERLSREYIALTNSRETDRLILECATLEEMDAEYNIGDILDEGIYEAVTVRRFSQTDSRMKALSRVFSKFLPETITPADAIIGKPKKSGLFASVTAQIPFSDGQAVTIVFHSPSGDAKRIGPDDEIIAYRWMLNKRDITHVVSPEGEGDVTLESVGKRIAQLVEKNSERFQRTQKDVKAQNDQLAALKVDADALSKENVNLMNGLRDQQDGVSAIKERITRTQGLVEKQQEINADLENQLAALNAKAKSDEANQKIAAETAAKQAAMDAEFEAMKDEALSMGMDQTVFDQLKHDGMINDLKGIMARQKEQSESDKQAEEYNRIRSVGEATVPGIRSQDMETAGKMWEMLQRGEVTQAEWEMYVEDLYSSNKAPRPEPVVPEVVPPVELNSLPPDDVDTLAAAPGPDLTPTEYKIWALEKERHLAEKLISEYPDPKDRPSNYKIQKWNGKKAYDATPDEARAFERMLVLIDAAIESLKSQGAIPGLVYSELEQRTAIDTILNGNYQYYLKKRAKGHTGPEIDSSPGTTAEPPAVATLNSLLSGAHDSDTVTFGNLLDDAAGQLEDAGLMDQYDSLLNQAADYLTGLLRKKAA